MRTLMTVQMDTEATNHAIRDGSLAKSMQSTLEQLHAEAAYFTTRDGQRTAYIVFDLHDTAEIPTIAEPFFMNMNARIDLAPVMNADDVQEGLGRLPHM
jgi:hypothetical protein